MMRRRMLYGKIIPSEEWDFDWDYSMGAITNYDVSQTTSGTATGELSEDKQGYILIAGDNAYIRLDFPQPTSFSTAIAEYEFTMINFIQANGLRLILASADQGKGIQIFLNSSGVNWILDSASNYESIRSAIDLNSRHKIRLELNYNGESKFYLDDILLHTSTNLSTYYVPNTRLFVQYAAQAVLHAVRIKYD